MPSPGPTSGNTTINTSRICDADAPEGKFVISTTLYSSAGSNREMLKEPTRQHETFIAHNVEFMLEEQKDGVCDQVI